MKKIFQSTNELEFELLRTYLEENGIPTFEINKRDNNAYVFLGRQELYVEEKDVDKAEELVKEYVARETES